MNGWLDYVGAIIVGGLLLLALVGLQSSIGNSATNQNLKDIVLADLDDLVEIIDRDFRHIGNKVLSGPAVSVSDSNRISFRGDVNRDGNADNVTYSLSIGPSPGHANALARQLVRTVNNQPPYLVGSGLTRFRLDYYDENGLPVILASQVKSIRVSLQLESKVTNDGTTAAVVWDRFITPNNLR